MARIVRMTQMGNQTRQFSRRHWMRAFLLGFVLVLAAIGGSASGQSVNPLLDRNIAGPPTPQEVQREEVRKIVQEMGVPAGNAVDPHAARGDTPAPDMSRVIPTSTDPKKLSTSLTIVLLLSLLTLAPSILLMTTCFTRIIIVMSLLRQALGAAQLPPNQVLIGLSLFMTFLVMTPTWTRINDVAIKPYNEEKLTQMQAIDAASGVLREFMITQISHAHNEGDVYLFHKFANKGKPEPKTWEEVSTMTIVPAYILSELKVAFLIGFRIYLPFLIIDMVISSVLISVGMQLLPPVMVSLPFKLLLFVLVDGWSLVCGMLMRSFG